MNRGKKIDAFILILLILISVNYAFLVNATLLDIPIITSYIFLIVPIIYLSLREKKDWIKILATVFLFGFIVGFPFTFLGELTEAWAIQVGSYKMFGIFYFPVVIAWMLMTALTAIIYQHFFQSKINVSKGLSKRYKTTALVLTCISFLIVYLCLKKPDFFTKKYSYLIIGSINVIPVLIYLIKKPHFLVSIWPIIIYFFILYFSIEYVGLNLKWWSFKGEYIGNVNLLNITFPIEEFVYWMLLYAPSLVCCYVSFVDVKSNSSN